MTMESSRDQFEGLKWVPALFYLEPQWSREPNLESVKQVVKTKLSSKDIHVTFLTKGAFNKIYVINSDEGEFIMRVSLPVDPRWKTLSEVATVEWICDNTRLPLPRIVAYDASRENPIGFEWILMSKIPGKTLSDAWRSTDFESKEKVVQQVANFCSSMFRQQLRGIGNIYPVSGLGSDPLDLGSMATALLNCGKLPAVGRIVSMHFFERDHISLPVPRGPFRSSKDWIEARLLCNELACEATIARLNEKLKEDGSKDEEEDLSKNEEEDRSKDEKEDESKYEETDEELRIRATSTLEIINKLKPLVGNFFPPTEEDEPSMLHHNDLHEMNILVDEAGTLTGVIDWECVSAVPLWKACYFPNFISTEKRSMHEAPNVERYNFDDESDLKCYWRNRMTYEQTLLRGYFLDLMRGAGTGLD